MVFAVALLLAGAAFGQDARTLFHQGVQLQQKGDLAGARGAYEQCLKLEPGRVDALSNLGLVLLQQNEPALAAARLGKAAALSPKHTPIRFYHGLALFRSGCFAEALGELDFVVGEQPGHAQALHLRGLTLLKLERIDEGISALESAVSANPNNADALYTLATAYIGRGRVPKAEALLAGPLKSRDTPEVHLLRGMILNTKSEWQAAVREFETARGVRPELPTLHTHLGHSYLLLGENQLAERALRTELAHSPEDFHGNVYLGWLYLREKQYAEASPHLAAALRRKPEHSGLLYLLAQVRHAEGDHAGAAALLEKSVAGSPEFTPAHVLLARVYAKLNRKEDFARQRRIIAKLNAAEQERNLGSRESYGGGESRSLSELAVQP